MPLPIKDSPSSITHDELYGLSLGAIVPSFSVYSSRISGCKLLRFELIPY